MTGTAQGRRGRGLWWLAAAATAGLALAYVGLVRTASGQRVDGRALEHRFVVTDGAARRMEQLLDAISARSVLVCSAALVLAALWRRRPVLAVGVAVALGGAAVIARALKDHVLTRTDLGGFGGVAYNTFPSGHATVGIALALALVMVTPARLAGAAVGAASVAAPTVGMAVLATGGHRPSDSIGAYLATLAWFSACAAAVAWVESATRAAPGQRAEPGPLPRVAVAVLAAAVVLATLAWRSLDGAARRPGISAGAYLVGCIGIDVVGVAAVAAFAVVHHGRRWSARDLASAVGRRPAG